MEILSLGLAFVFAFWCMNICEDKGRTKWKGFVAGFFIGIFGVALCYMLSDKTSKPNK